MKRLLILISLVIFAALTGNANAKTQELHVGVHYVLTQAKAKEVLQNRTMFQIKLL